MQTLERLGPDHLRSVVTGYRDALRAHQENLNRLNVYPVPDGDTGTNMALTVESVVSAMGGCLDMPSTCKAISHGSLMGARGNSGIILSQVLRGLAEELSGLDSADGKALAHALALASEAAYQAVLRPVEGTILTVVREAAEAANRVAENGAPLVDVLDAANSAAREAVANTPELLPKLKEHGVVDAGGAGFALLLDVLLNVTAGRPVPQPERIQGGVGGVATVRPFGPNGDRTARTVATAEPHSEGDVGDLRYEVMYFLEAPDEAVAAFKDVWMGIGDSIVVVGGDGLWNCHIHTDDIGAAIEAALDCGRPRDIRVTDLHEQVDEERWVREAPPEEPESPVPVPTAVVAVATGEGVRRIFRSLGVQRIVTGGQSMNPSTAQLAEAVEAAPADEVVVLPNNRNIIPVAEQVHQLTTKTVRVVPTTSVTEGFAALMEYDPQAPVEQNASAMCQAAGRIVSAELTRAVRDAVWENGPIREGDYIGLTEEGIRSVDRSIEAAAIGLLEAVIDRGHEIVTVIEGEGASVGVTRRITAWIEENHPEMSAEVHHGGQPLYPYLFGVE